MMSIRPIAPVLLLALAASFLSGCSDDSNPYAPWGGSPSQELTTRFYWERELFPDTTKLGSVVWINCRSHDAAETVDAGVVRFAGVEVPEDYYQTGGGYFYFGVWSNPAWTIDGTYNGSFVIDAAGTTGFQPFADTIPVRMSEPVITHPQPGDTISMTEGFTLNWSGEPGGGKVRVKFTSLDGGERVRDGYVPDNGRFVVEPDMMEGLAGGEWSITVEREYEVRRNLSGGRRSILNSNLSCTTYILAEE